MEIISHRGYWKSSDEKNTNVAFDRSFIGQFGTETDIRDFNGDLVISHDIADSNSISVEEFLKCYNKHNCSGTLALNVKADGLQEKVKKQLEAYEIKNYFFFDMSIPDTIGYMNANLNFFSRQSEYEPIPPFYEKCNGIWLDAFIDIWFDETLITKHITNGKTVALVSPELHKRDQISFWKMLKDAELHLKENIILCTDFPEHATKFFD